MALGRAAYNIVNQIKAGKENSGSEGDDHRAEWLILISDYIDGTLPEAASQRLKTHLAECAQCTADLEGLRQTVKLLRRLPEVSAPRSFILTPAQARRLRPSPVYRYARVAAAIAAAFLVFAFVLDLVGLFAAPAAQPSAVAVATADPTPTLEAVGSLSGGTNRAGAGSISGLTTNITATATANPTKVATTAPQTQAAASEDLTPIRWVEIVLAVVLIMFASFAFVLRPRAPGRLKI